MEIREELVLCHSFHHVDVHVNQIDHLIVGESLFVAMGAIARNASDKDRT